jgi:hypothetical protein
MVSEELRTLIAKAAEVERDKSAAKDREQIGREAMLRREHEEYERLLSRARGDAAAIFHWLTGPEVSYLCIAMIDAKLRSVPICPFVSLLSSGRLQVRQELKYFGSRTFDVWSTDDLVAYAGPAAVLDVAEKIRAGRIMDVIAGLLKESVS